MLQGKCEPHGIEQPVVAHIFEPFLTTREVGEGTGLDMSELLGAIRRQLPN